MCAKFVVVDIYIYLVKNILFELVAGMVLFGTLTPVKW